MEYTHKVEVKTDKKTIITEVNMDGENDAYNNTRLVKIISENQYFRLLQDLSMRQ